MDNLEVMVRTVEGEAGGEGRDGWIAVAYVIVNRAHEQFKTIEEVCLAPKQFSTWNKGSAGGNHAHNIGPGHKLYEEIKPVAQAVMRGHIPDPTGGAVNYYAPRGMPGGHAPYWWHSEMRRQHGTEIKIGHQIFLKPGRR